MKCKSKSKSKSEYKIIMCTVCGRDHKVFPRVTKDSSRVIYRAPCPYCDTYDTHGHLHFNYDEPASEIHWQTFKSTRPQ